jgi:hypothetical protein
MLTGFSRIGLKLAGLCHCVELVVVAGQSGARCEVEPGAVGGFSRRKRGAVAWRLWSGEALWAERAGARRGGGRLGGLLRARELVEEQSGSGVARALPAARGGARG